MSIVVAFVSKKGGVGKSTLARALATVAVRRGLLTTLADLDSEQRTTTRWQRLRERNAILPSLTVKAFDNADGAIASEQDVDVLILDAPGHAPRETLEAASVAHLIVQPSGAGFDDLQPAVDLFYQLAAAGISKSRLLIVLSRICSMQKKKMPEPILRSQISRSCQDQSPSVRDIETHTIGVWHLSKARAKT